MAAALGISLHSMWAAGVTIASGPTFVGRTRIELVGDGLPGQAYHAAAESGMDAESAAKLIDDWAGAARAAARAAIDAIAAEAAASGHQLAACAIPALPKTLPPLAAILRSHPLLHAAEGQLALEAVADAADSAGLRVVHVDPASLPDPAGHAIDARVAGRPWAADQKKAAAAALAALAALAD